MRKQFKKNYIQENKREEKRSYKYESKQEKPKIKEFYSSKISSKKEPSQVILTEKYKKSSPSTSKNVESYSEYYKFTNSGYTPYHQRNRNLSLNNIFSQNMMGYSEQNNYCYNYNTNSREKFLTCYLGNTDLRNEYSPLAEARVNIRKKLIEEKDAPKLYQNMKDNITDEKLLENFKYYEIKNVRNNSDQKYDSITRVVGYSNLIPLHRQRLLYNFDDLDLDKKEEYNYRKIVTKTEQKKEFRKPAQLDINKKQEIIKKYEIKKKPEIKKEEENKYKKYERKKETEIKKETKKTEIKKETKEIKKNIEIKKEIKEPKIIKRKENVKAVFSLHSGRYNCKSGDITNEINNLRKNYKANTQERNVRKVEIVQKNSKSAKKVENVIKEAKTEIKKKEYPKSENKIKKEEKVITKKIEIKPVITTNTVKKINISENMSNYKRKKEIKEYPKINRTEIKRKNIEVKTESYGNIEEKYKRENIDINNIINIKEINKIYEMKKRNKYTSPKIKTKTINLGDNYKYYERKYMQSPDENYCTLHQRRSQRIIYGEQIIEGYTTKKMKIYKTKPIIREESYDNKMLSNSKSSCNKYYLKNNSYNNERRYNDENGEYYYQEQEYSYHI